MFSFLGGKNGAPGKFRQGKNQYYHLIEGESKMVTIRSAEKKDIKTILILLDEVNEIHEKARPDIFKRGQKYHEKDIEDLLNDKKIHILVAEEENTVLGYAILKEEKQKEDELMKERRFLYMDDLCVDSKTRGKGVGTKLLRAAEDLARSLSYPSITLRVWGFNKSAIAFYQREGYLSLYEEREKKL